MKRMMKKLLALALSGAMVLSMGVSALADDEYGDREINASGSMEGVKEEDVIVVTVPTEAEATGYSNMIVDPFNLIQRSGGHAYNGSEAGKVAAADAVNPFKTTVTKKNNQGQDVTEAVSHLMYFKNTTVTKDAEGNETSEVTYSGTSDKMTITNKSDHAISVALSLEATDGFDAPLEMLDAASMDAAATSLDSATSPKVFLALISGNTVKPVLAPEQVLPNVTLTDTEKKGYVTSVEIVKGANATEETMGELNAAFDKITFAVTATKATNAQATVDADDFDQTVTVTATVDNSLSGWTVAGDSGTAKNLYGTFATDSAPAANPTATIDIMKGNDVVAQVNVAFSTVKVAEAVKTANATLDVANKFGIKLEKNDGVAKISKDLNWVEDAYTLVKTGVGADGLNNVYRNIMLEDYATGDKKDDFENISFQIAAGITAASKWTDPEDANVGTLGYTLTWEIEPCTDMGPSARATTYLTKQKSAGIVKYSLGLGDSAATQLTSVTWGDNNTAYDINASGVHDKSAQTIVINSTSAADIYAAGKVKLNFDNGASVDVDMKAPS
jgi:hypothetical protein